jgi:hypothetical protein
MGIKGDLNGTHFRDKYGKVVRNAEIFRGYY